MIGAEMVVRDGLLSDAIQISEDERASARAFVSRQPDAALLLDMLGL